MTRDAVLADMPAILEIYNDAILNTTAVYKYTPRTLEEQVEWYEDKINSGYPVLVDEEDGVVRGFAAFGSFRAYAAYKYTVEHSVYVDKRFRGQHIGSNLMKVLLKLADEQGYAVMVGGIDAENKGSIAIHEKLGFKYAGTVHKAGYKFGKWLDLCFYEYILTGPKEPKEG